MLLFLNASAVLGIPDASGRQAVRPVGGGVLGDNPEPLPIGPTTVIGDNVGFSRQA